LIISTDMQVYVYFFFLQTEQSCSSSAATKQGNSPASVSTAAPRPLEQVVEWSLATI